MMHDFTIVDLLTVAVVGVSMILAIWRGFIWETLSIISWAAAAIASIYFGSAATHYLAHWISTPWLAYVAGYALVFLVVLIPLSFASYRLSATVKDSPIGLVDRFLGGVFGVVRGLALVGGLYLLFSVFVPPSQQPKPLHDARLLPIIRSSAQVLVSLAPVGWHVEEKLQPHNDASSPLQAAVNASAPSGNSRQAPADKPYGVRERRALDRLIEATGSSGTVKP